MKNSDVSIPIEVALTKKSIINITVLFFSIIIKLKTSHLWRILDDFMDISKRVLVPFLNFSIIILPIQNWEKVM